MLGVKGHELVLAVCIALNPAQSRSVRKEQWAADLRDCSDVGISRSSLLLGAFRSSSTARFHETMHRGVRMLSHSMMGKNLKPTIYTIGAVLAIAGGAFVGIQTAQNPVHDTAQDVGTTSGVERPTTIPLDDWSPAAPMDSTISVDTSTGNIRQAFIQAKDEGKQLRLISGTGTSVVVNPAMEMDSITIVDVKSGKTLANFPVDNPAK
jgi:hypothetical protein